MKAAPNYLRAHADLYHSDPRAAGIRWFRDARYGLFMHYGLYSLLGRHEWVQCKEKIHVAEYEKLKERFTAEKFDADYICDLAVDAQMRYVNITTRHHDGFCLFDSRQTDFTSVNSPCGRDLVGELAAACDSRGLGLCLYYSHGRDWRHPHAPNNDQWGGSARPQYDDPEPAYATGDAHDLDIYLNFVTAQITELLTNYDAPIAAIWLDGIATPLSGDYSKFRCQDLYDRIHALSPHALVSYKQSLLGTEDFKAPEHKAVDDDGRPCEICTTMDPGSWGYFAEHAGRHKTPDDVWDTIRIAREANCNLLLNTGPLPDGSIDQEDAQTLREVGERLRRKGFPGEHQG